jgi:hypothetical protein
MIPLVLVFPDLIYQFKNFELFIDLCLLLDILLTFFKLDEHQKLVNIN